MKRNIMCIMRLRCALAIGAFVMTLVTLCPAQERFETGWLKGFTKSPTEHVINQVDRPFMVRAVRGVVLDRNGAEMDGALVEIRDETGTVKGTETNGKGTFKLARIPSGTYKFKVTMNGFQSVVGDLIVSPKANKIDQMKIVLNVGV